MYYLRYPGNSSKDWINKFKCICLKALALWTKLGIEKAHVVSHDMGDSVLTEILTRCLHQIDFFKSQLSLDWNVAPCLIGLPTSSRVSSSPTEAWDTTSSTLDLLRWNFQFSLYPYSIFFHSRFFWNHLWEKFWENLDQGNCLMISDIEYFCLFRNIAGISDKAGANQLASIWGKTYPDKNLQLADIKEMQVLVRNCIG